jgi:ABC-type Fe3+/spermidine/putrescine transport system ATPase subunit
VADFIGASNFLAATVVGFDPGTRKATVRSEHGLLVTGLVTDPNASPAEGDAVTVATRPERLEVRPLDAPDDANGGPGWTRVSGRISQGTYLGDQTEYRVATDEAGELIVRRQNTRGTTSSLGAGPGDPVVARWHEDANLILTS